MNLPRFIQIHTLHNYPGALLNRDDAGLEAAQDGGHAGQGFREACQGARPGPCHGAGGTGCDASSRTHTAMAR